LRDKARTVRQEAHAGSSAAGGRIAEQFRRAITWRPDHCIAGYVPIGQEADVMPLLRSLADDRASLALPVVTAPNHPLRFRCWTPGEELEMGTFNCWHPGPAADWAVPDILLVPLLAFDRTGARLGYGGGYYDRTLALLRRERPIVAVGIAFAAQEMHLLPHEPHDERLDWIVTEQGAWEI
jgi:5-formyltetrahydrofolate cyclo-ligase